MTNPHSHDPPGTSRRWVALGTALALFVVMLLLAPLSAAPQSSRKPKVSDLRRRLNRLRSEAGSKRRRLRQTKVNQTRISDQLNHSYRRLEEARKGLNEARSRVRKVRAEFEACTKRLKEAEARFDRQKKRMGQRIATDYREGPVTFLEVILSSRTISDFLDRDYYVRRVMDRDATMLAGLRQAKEDVTRERHEWQRLHGQATEAVADQEGFLAMVQAQAYTREELLRRVRQERALQEQELVELERDSTSIQRSIQAEMRRRAKSGKPSNLPAWTGRWRMPVNGKITSGYGYRMHPILRRRRLHTGLDISGKMGAPVRSASAGEVLFASWRGGYGRCIILLHGNNYSTLYGHLSSISVRKGQKVKVGEVIGKVGSTGLSTGPHLHFEVRRNGVPINPR